MIYLFFPPDQGPIILIYRIFFGTGTLKTFATKEAHFFTVCVVDIFCTIPGYCPIMEPIMVITIYLIPVNSKSTFLFFESFDLFIDTRRSGLPQGSSVLLQADKNAIVAKIPNHVFILLLFFDKRQHEYKGWVYLYP